MKKLTDILKSLKEVLILIVLIIGVYLVYQYYQNKKSLEIMELKSQLLQNKLDSIEQNIAINEQKILFLNTQIQNTKDSINQYKNNVQIVNQFYDKKYKDIVNYSNIDIYNEFHNIFTENNIR